MDKFIKVLKGIVVVIAVLYQVFNNMVYKIDGGITFYIGTILGTIIWAQEKPEKGK
jgi:hypothetical protein